MKDHFCPEHWQLLPEAEGNRYRFFCDLSGAAVCVTPPVRGGSPEEELKLAWEMVRDQFHHCRGCGRWVSSVMYNADELKCVDCAPWREEPRFCPECGTRLGESLCCPVCGWRWEP